MSAGMLVAAVGKLESAGLISPILSHVWNTTWLIDDRTLFGHIVSGFLGYRAKPSLTEVLAYLIYFASILWWLRRQNPEYR
jgi:high-affinity iron transporter